MQQRFARQEAFLRRRIPGGEHDGASGVLRAAARLDDETVFAGATNAAGSILDVGKARSRERRARDLIEVRAIQSARNKIVRVAPRAEPAYEVIGVVRKRAHQMRARVQDVLGVSRAVGSAAAQLSGLEERQRKPHGGPAGKLRRDGATAEPATNNSRVDPAEHRDLPTQR